MIRALLALPFLAAPALALDYDPEGPFRPGEGFGVPATCATMERWLAVAPDTSGRVSMTIDGEIVLSHWDGALAYLIMCDEADIQVMCVTYHPEEVTGETVRFAGGVNRHGERQVVLDPCLVYPAD